MANEPASAEDQIQSLGKFITKNTRLTEAQREAALDALRKQNLRSKWIDSEIAQIKKFIRELNTHLIGKSAEALFIKNVCGLTDEEIEATTHILPELIATGMKHKKIAEFLSKGDLWDDGEPENVKACKGLIPILKQAEMKGSDIRELLTTLADNSTPKKIAALIETAPLLIAKGLKGDNFGYVIGELGTNEKVKAEHITVILPIIANGINRKTEGEELVDAFEDLVRAIKAHEISKKAVTEAASATTEPKAAAATPAAQRRERAARG